jgi:hypothetical protein
MLTKKPKKVQSIINGYCTIYTEDSHGRWASISKNDLDYDPEEQKVTGGEIVIRYGQGEMPAFNHEEVTQEDLESSMRQIQPDLRKWVFK